MKINTQLGKVWFGLKGNQVWVCVCVCVCVSNHAAHVCVCVCVCVCIKSCCTRYLIILSITPQ